MVRIILRRTIDKKNHGDKPYDYKSFDEAKSVLRGIAPDASFFVEEDGRISAWEPFGASRFNFAVIVKL
jgi:hypothetical protein